LAYGDLLIGITSSATARIKNDELEKKLRFKTVERFGGKKGDLTKAVEEAVKTWVAKEK
jgi:hypothetical protein